MKTIILSQGKKAIVDNKDFNYLNQWKWYYGGRGYAIRHSEMIKGKRDKIYMHRVIMNNPKDKEIDHIDGNRINNQKSNLRICKRMENLHNQKVPKNNKSGYKGVCYLKNYKKWISYICVNNKNIYLGRFNNKIDAIESRKKADKLYYGDFSYKLGI